MSRKLYALLSVLLIATFILAACGTPTEAPAPASPTEAPAEAAPTAGPGGSGSDRSPRRSGPDRGRGATRHR